MILLKRDWQRYPSAIADYSTTNETFLRMASLYRSMGVENCLFPLALHQPALQGVDPHGGDLSDELKIMIAMECRFNPWYYIREVVRIPPVAGSAPVRFRANRANLALYWLFFNSIDIALIQPRQTGKSVSTDTLMVLLNQIMLRNTDIIMLTKDNSLRVENVERLKQIRDLLPQYLVPKTREDADNQIELTCTAYNNKYMTGVGQGSERAANKLGRGFTVPIIHIDEPPFIDHIGITLPAALASATAARDEARRNGTPYGNIFTTTAGKKDDRDGAFMYKFIHDGSIWSERYLDASDHETLVKLIRTNSAGRKLLVNGTFSHRQLGFTDEWLYEKIVETASEGEAADRDFLNIWTSGTQSSPLTAELNEIIFKSEMEPLHSEITRDNYIVRWYIKEEHIRHTMASSHFVIGLDTSEAVGRDSIGMVVSDIRDMSTVAALTINETNLIRFAQFLADFLIKYPNTVLVPERKSTGLMIIDLLLVVLPKHDIDPFRRIYNTIVDNHMERKEEFRLISSDLGRRPEHIYERFKKFFGFNTDGDKRNLLYSKVLQNVAKKSGHVVRDKVLSGEIRGLVVKRGRIDHQASGNDDMVVAWLLNEWFLTHSKNLSHYGIDSSLVLRDIAMREQAKLSDMEIYERQRQDEIKRALIRTYEELEEAVDSIEITRLEHRLRVLGGQLVDLDETSFSVDAVIANARETRSRNLRRMERNKSILSAESIWGW